MTKPEVHLRMLTSEDVDWLVEVDRTTASAMARSRGWDPEKLAAELDEGRWASEDRWGWAIVVDGVPGGFTLVTGVSTGVGDMDIRISSRHRGKGVGREVLRQLAEHHFRDTPSLQRLTGRTHEHNVPMQRAFNAAGFRMEARFRDSVEHHGTFASEWGYALTRGDFEAGRHRADDDGYDLHGLTFQVERTDEDGTTPSREDVLFKFLQEGRRALARYSGGDIIEGELAGILVNDVLNYRFVQERDGDDHSEILTGYGRARLQRRQDGRLEVVDEWTNDDGRTGKSFLVERR